MTPQRLDFDAPVLPVTRLDAVAAAFRARPEQWIDLLELMTVGGCYAARTRVSECRTKLGMRIENKVITLPNGSKRSLYRMVHA